MSSPDRLSSRKPRHQSRVVALQSLYQLDIQRSATDSDSGGLIEASIQEAAIAGEVADYARNLAAGAWANHPRYDEMITGVSAHWDVVRMAVVDRNILRLALFELLEHPDVPV